MTTPEPKGLPAHIEPVNEGEPVSTDVAALTAAMANMSAEQKDEYWFKHVYQGDKMPQLTWRAVFVGGILGMLMSAANLYTTLSIGWAFGIAITACVLSFVMWNFVVLCSGKRVSQMSVLENACMASCASAAGYSTGSTIATMFGALALLQDIPPGKTAADMPTWAVPGGTPGILTLFTFCTGLMGVFLAIPMKRQMINHEQLPFPSGIAAAETLRSLYSKSLEAIHKAYALVIALALGLLVGFLRVGDDVLDKVSFLRKFFDFFGNRIRIPSEIEMRFIDRLYPGQRHAAGFAFEPSALLIAAGMIVGMRISLSLVLSSLLLYAVVGPKLAAVDAAHLEAPAMAVLEASQATSKAPAPPADVAASAVAAAVSAAEKLGLDAAPVRTAAQNAATIQLDEIAAAQAEAERVAKKENRSAKKLSESELADQRDAIATGIGNAAAKTAAFNYANREAIKAGDAAAASAKAAGQNEAQIEAARAAAFNPLRYQPNFIWDWGGGTITITRWSLWGGTSLMVFSSLMAVALQWKTLVRAFRGQRAEAGLHERAELSRIEVPGMWMILGMVPITIAMVWLQIQAFKVSWYAGIIAVAMSFVLSLVASRATGETDTTPIGAMGKVMQLMFAGLAPANISANLASAGIAANSASSSADLLTDLKTGYLLGANPRKQFLAQFFGVFFGTVAIVPIWYLMVPNREKLESFALPSTRAWEAVARVLVRGVAELPPSAVWAIFIGAVVGVILPIVDRLLPQKYRGYMPSATGMGLAWVMPFNNAFSFFIGAVIALVWSKIASKSCEKYNVPIASGLIAGESLMAAALAITATVVGLMIQAGWIL
ncbi:MAG: OPT/YSL family transporter [Phycisphaeraceae bacterium]|nr:OPT/YSL family transporter [Phycisphaeraceae bacterium]